MLCRALEALNLDSGSAREEELSDEEEVEVKLVGEFKVVEWQDDAESEVLSPWSSWIRRGRQPR